MKSHTTLTILRSTPKWWTVKITGNSDDATIDELIRSYQEILKMGVKNVCLDLTRNNPEFTLVHRRTPDVLQVAMGFQRVAVLVSEAKTAFAIKATTKGPEDRFRVFYEAEQSQLQHWLNE